MEDSNQGVPAHPSSEAQVGFPSPVGREPEKKGGMIKWGIAVIGILAIAGAGSWYVLREPSNLETTPKPTPDTQGLTSFATPTVTTTPEPSPTPTPVPVEKAELKVEILNGTGTPGDAGLAKAELESLGYEDITADNAEEQEEVDTTVTYSRDLDPALIDEIVESLESVFSSVKTRKGTIAGDFDIRVVTGEKGKSADDKPAEETEADPSDAE